MIFNSKEIVPIVPIKDIFVFPQMAAPVFFSDKKATIAIENAFLTENHQVILVAKKNPDRDEISTEDLYDIGILGKTSQVVKFPDGIIKCLIEGISRVKITNIKKEDQILKGEYEILDTKSEVSDSLKALHNLVTDQFKQYIQKSTKIGIESFLTLIEIKDSGKLADLVATYLNIELEEKQKVVETLNVFERLEIVSKYLSRELELLFIEENLQEKVKYKLGKTQKEFLLKEKLHAIKEELGLEEGSDEAAELKERIEKAKLPKKVNEHLYKEVAKLERMSILTSETSVIRTYIETVLELPWNKQSKDVLDIDRARKILDEDHYGLDDVKERILEFLAVKKLSKEQQPTIICFSGPPGVGKTSLARSIARTLNKKFAQASLGGINDESEIRGHRRTYVGAMPGKIIRAIQDAGTKNPVILLDEIEKMIPSHMGDPTAAMLEVLDPAQNKNFSDHYVDLPFDLSEVFFIATANSVENLYKPLRDRLEIINLSGYTEEEKEQIAKKFLMPRQFKLNGVNKDNLNISVEAIRHIIDDYTREAGVRELERNIAKLCRKYALNLFTKNEQNVTINKDNLSHYLGVPRFEREKAEVKPQVGLVHGLAWTAVGGELLDIEATIMPGNGHLNMTGRLGEIMQESAQIALSYARSNYSKFNLPNNIQEKYDFHIHATDAATPKDGPSAGIALAIAIISAISKRPVRLDVAMTGELTLHGKIMPIGGLKEKSIAAIRNNIKTVYIPAGNKKDLEEIPDYVKNKLEYKPVEDLFEVIDKVLLPVPKNILTPSNNGKNKNHEKIQMPKNFLTPSN
ncbi:MAG: endopeptidase La [Candidatus Gastranaerophilaceae bacterium]|jgi:ATP-dependent Lon protease